MSKYIGSSAVNLSTTSADVTGNADIDGNLTVGGNLTVSGTTITVDHATAQTVDLGDGDKIRLGADYELQLWSDGTTGQISGDFNHTGSITTDGLTVDGTGTIDLTSDSGTTLKLSRDGSAGQIASIVMQDGGDAQNRINSSGGALEFEYGPSNTNAMKIANNGDINFYATDGTTQAFHWDAAAQSLGLGITDPASKLHLQSTNSSVIKLETTAANTYPGINFINDAQRYDMQIDGATDSFRIYDSTASSSRLVLDTSGNLLVGKSNADGGVAGFEARSTGETFATATGAALYAKRTTGNGDIIVVQGSSGAVGSIGNSGTALLFENPNANSYIAFHANNQSSGIFYQDGTTKNLAPYTARTGEFDLGNSGGRFKDLYLSGTAISSRAQGGTAFYASTAGSYIQVTGSSSSAMGFGMTGGNGSPATAASTSLGFHHWDNSSWANPVNITRDGIAFNGDTASDNALDDYEEGTWNVTDGSGAGLTFTFHHNRYTKIGRFVMAHIRCQWPTTSSTALARLYLPLATDGNSDNSTTGGVVTEQNYDGSVAITASINESDRVLFRTNGTTALTNAQLSGKLLRFTVTYFTP